MIPARVIAHMIAERGSTPETMARAVVEAVMLRSAFERIDDGLAGIVAHSSSKPDPEHAQLAVLAADIRHRISAELAQVDRALIGVEP